MPFHLVDAIWHFACRFSGILALLAQSCNMSLQQKEKQEPKYDDQLDQMLQKTF